jgi:hypothetical protein
MVAIFSFLIQILFLFHFIYQNIQLEILYCNSTKSKFQNTNLLHDF